MGKLIAYYVDGEFMGEYPQEYIDKLEEMRINSGSPVQTDFKGKDRPLGFEETVRFKRLWNLCIAYLTHDWEIIRQLIVESEPVIKRRGEKDA